MHGFNQKYIKFTDITEELEKSLSEKQLEEFQEMMKLNYEIEQYYFALSYSLGVKYGEDLQKL